MMETLFIIFLGCSLLVAGLIFSASFYFRSHLRVSWRKIIAVIFYLVLFGTVSVAGIYFLTEKTIVSGKQCRADYPSGCWGYSIKEYPYRDFCTLTIWHSWRVNNSYSFPCYWKSPTVKDERWLADGTAIYLHLGVNKDDSAQYELPMRLIYDFESGEMSAQKHSADWLNSTLDSRNTGKLHLSENDFQQVLSELENAR